MEPELAVDFLMKVTERKASKPLPPAQRPQRIQQLTEQRLQLSYVEARLADVAILRGDFVTRLETSPPECVLGIMVRPPKLNERPRPKGAKAVRSRPKQAARAQAVA